METYARWAGARPAGATGHGTEALARVTENVNVTRGWSVVLQPSRPDFPAPGTCGGAAIPLRAQAPAQPLKSPASAVMMASLPFFLARFMAAWQARSSPSSASVRGGTRLATAALTVT
jgi:hypothetical protein